jgi:transcriptional regulator with XRE-family HTH domain
MTWEVMSLLTVRVYRGGMATATIGPMMRDWRTRRGRSQLDLSLDVGVSTRHLSCVENGRSRPSPELVLAVAEHLDVPLRERNTMLLAAGFAPRYSAHDLDDRSMRRISESLQRVLDLHDPFPGVVIDRQWNVLLSNDAASVMTGGLPDEVVGPIPNVFRMCLHPAGLAARTRNFDDWAGYLLRQLRRTIAVTGDEALAALEVEVLGYQDVARVVRRSSIHRGEDFPILVPFILDVGGVDLAFFTTLTTFGTPLDVTLDELAIELFYPADDATDSALRTSRVAITPSGR